MKRFTLAVCAGLFAAAMALPALAADMPGPVYKAPSALWNWTGFYMGINGGYAWGTSNWTAPVSGVTTGDFKLTGAMVGGTIGYNLQTGVWVWGGEADLDATWLRGTDSTLCCETKNSWLGTARLRVGYAFDRWLPYLTGGAAFGDVKITPVGFASLTDTRFGWTAGAGLEYAFMGAWSAKLEYLYADLGNASCDVATCGIANNINFKTNMVRGGVNYHF
ncbi:MAG TPA: outer membrane protein [Pseudolabrys sp.]|jgi:outer membrane immunogenic protein